MPGTAVASGDTNEQNKNPFILELIFLQGEPANKQINKGKYIYIYLYIYIIYKYLYLYLSI